VPAPPPPEFDLLPRARVEALIADVRVAMALGTLVISWLENPRAGQSLAHTLMLGYAVYSLAAAALLRHGTWLSAAEQIMSHGFDLVFFAVLTAVAGRGAAPAPNIAYFVFLVTCGGLRWGTRGALVWTAIAVAGFVIAAMVRPAAAADPIAAVAAALPLIVLGGLLVFFSSYHPRVEREMLALASWPHRVPHDVRDVATEILERADAILPARQIVLMWEVPEAESTEVVAGSGAELQWRHEPAGAIAAAVAPALRELDFQAPHAARGGRLLVRSRGRYREMRGPAVQPPFLARFAAAAVQSAWIDGEHVHGRLFWLDRRDMRLDDLVVGALVARLAAARLDTVYLLDRLEDAAAVNARLEVARDLHDSLMQMLTGTALQLTAAGRLLPQDPEAAKTRLAVAREQVEESEDTLRGLIRRLRVGAGDAAPAPPSLESRLLGFIRRVQEQWPPRLVLGVGPGVDRIREDLADEIMLIVREGVLNAARHAAATHIRVLFRITPGTGAGACDALQVSIRDDGRGFPFVGTLDLDALNAADVGPVTLKERVAALGATLQIASTSAGSDVVVTFTSGWERSADGHSPRSR
jgi:signal transduction histidine kinase